MCTKRNWFPELHRFHVDSCQLDPQGAGCLLNVDLHSCQCHWAPSWNAAQMHWPHGSLWPPSPFWSFLASGSVVRLFMGRDFLWGQGIRVLWTQSRKLWAQTQTCRCGRLGRWCRWAVGAGAGQVLLSFYWSECLSGQCQNHFWCFSKRQPCLEELGHLMP